MSQEDLNNKTLMAEDLAKEYRQISVATFFERNRHLLGYDNTIRALLTVVKEAVDNSLDAAEEARILPDIKVEIKQLAEDRFTVIVEDNGPGIVKKYIPNVFAQLLFGSKFHRLRQSRGIQGLGISCAVLYSQLTTGKTAKITSKTEKNKPAHYYELHIDTQKNLPEIVKEEVIDWSKDHGTKVELELQAKYSKGKQSVDEYLRQIAIVNPHLYLVYITPENETLEFPRATNELPKEPIEIKPHPHGVELGILIRLLRETKARTLQNFLTSDFCRIGGTTAKNICKEANLPINIKPSKIEKNEIENLFKAMQNVKIIAPPTDCLSPIGEDLILKGLKKEINAEFYISSSRSPSVYRGFPFSIEAGIAWGGELDKESQVRLLRFANRVPLLYQQGACAIIEAVIDTNWRSYGLSQSSNSLPVGPAIILVHISSVWVPFTSESKEAIAHYPEIIKEIKLALQDCGRKLIMYIRRTVKANEHKEKIDLFEKYIPELASSLAILTDNKKEILQEKLQKLLKKELPSLEANNGTEKN